MGWFLTPSEVKRAVACPVAASCRSDRADRFHGGAGALAAGTVAWLLAATGAAASSADAAPPVGAGRTLRFEVSGTITPRCALQQDEQAGSFGDLLDPVRGGTISKTIDLQFDVDCNSAFNLELRSRRGALSLEAQKPIDGFRASIPYEADVMIGRGTVVRDCDSEQMGAAQGTACAALVRDPRGVSGRGVVRLSVESNSRPVLSGRYTDQLVLVVSPFLGGNRN